MQNLIRLIEKIKDHGAWVKFDGHPWHLRYVGISRFRRERGRELRITFQGQVMYKGNACYLIITVYPSQYGRLWSIKKGDLLK